MSLPNDSEYHHCTLVGYENRKNHTNKIGMVLTRSVKSQLSIDSLVSKKMHMNFLIFGSQKPGVYSISSC